MGQRDREFGVQGLLCLYTDTFILYVRYLIFFPHVPRDDSLNFE